LKTDNGGPALPALFGQALQAGMRTRAHTVFVSGQPTSREMPLIAARGTATRPAVPPDSGRSESVILETAIERSDALMSD